MSRFLLSFSLAFFLLTGFSTSFAAGGDEGQYLLPVAAGVASPSVTSIFFGENPAGFMHITRTKLELSAYTPDTDWHDTGSAAAASFGNGAVGGGIGVHFPAAGSRDPELLWGIGAMISNLNLSFGLSGSVDGSGDDQGNDTSGNFGVIYNPDGDYQLGLVLYDVLDNLDTYGLGAAIKISDSARVALDGISTNGRTDIIIGLGFHIENIQMSAGYRFSSNDSENTETSDAALVGLGFKLSDTFLLQGYYNIVQKYYAGLTIQF